MQQKFRFKKIIDVDGNKVVVRVFDNDKLVQLQNKQASLAAEIIQAAGNATRVANLQETKDNVDAKIINLAEELAK